MTIRDMALAARSIIWGFAFVTYSFGLESFSAPQLVALRFLIACVPVILVPRPPVPWSSILLIGTTLFAGQFLLLFLAFEQGMPSGVASATQQMQAFFTVLLAAWLFREIPTRRQGFGLTIALGGLVLIGSSLGSDLTPVSLALALAAAFSWAVGNILIKRTGDVAMFPLMVWASLVPPLPLLLVSQVYGSHASLLDSLRGASWTSIGAVVYLGTLSTILAYATWAFLLKRYPAPVVAPFSLLAPCTGIVASLLIFAEVPGPIRGAGMIMILVGLAVIVLPLRRPGTLAASNEPR
jgi:O-acetylserine/cysteine efflux transporter